MLRMLNEPGMVVKYIFRQVEYKTTDVSPRVIFLTRYADQVLP